MASSNIRAVRVQVHRVLTSLADKVLGKKRASASTSEETTAMSDPDEVKAFVSSLKVVELKDELKKRHLSYVGNKGVLVERLRENMLQALQQTTDQGEEEEEELEQEGGAEAEEAEKEEMEAAETADQDDVSFAERLLLRFLLS